MRQKENSLGLIDLEEEEEEGVVFL